MPSDFFDSYDSDAVHLSQPSVTSEGQTSVSWLEPSRFDHPANGLAETIDPLPPLHQDHPAPALKISYVSIHASPLMPLRTRDLQALTELFQQDEIESIEADIMDNLLRRSPTPHWEDLDSHLLHDSL